MPTGTQVSQPVPHAPLLRARRRAARSLLAHLVPDAQSGGALFHAPVKSRALETALTLHLLQKHDLEPDWRGRLRAHLTACARDADAFGQLIAAAVLGQAGRDAGSELQRVMASVEYASTRKRALLATLLLELDLVSPEEHAVAPEHFSVRAHHRFSRLYGAALRLILARKTGADVDGRDDAELLRRSQGADGSWEEQALITLLALLGLGREHECFAPGIRFLQRIARPDGGIPFIDNQDTWVTSLAASALHAAGEIDDGTRRGLALYLASRQHLNGGWSFADGVVQTDTDCAGTCTRALIELGGERSSWTIDRGNAYFHALQRADGGYPTYEREEDSEVTMTATVLLAQSLRARRDPRLVQPGRRAVRFLLERQKSDGRFERSWSRSESYSVFRAQWALLEWERLSPGVDLTPARRRSRRFLLENQRADGGWGQTDGVPSDALSTAYALAALGVLRRSLAIDPAKLEAGRGYLLSQQAPDTGEITSIPDIAGPRPFVFDTPLLATIFPLLALAFVEPSWS